MNNQLQASHLALFTLLISITNCQSVDQYELVKSYSGPNFFDDFTFTTYWASQSGQMMNEQWAQIMNLINATDKYVYIGVDHTYIYNFSTKGRPTVQISTKQNYDNGLFILRAQHMPYGCGVWPGFWLYGPNWPIDGEIDVVENINFATADQATLHTGPNCDFSSVKDMIQGNITGYLASTNCSYQPGCSIENENSTSFGKGFDDNGGGLWAVEINDNIGIRMWSFLAPDIPSDIINKKPDPSKWGMPYAYFPFGEWCPSTNFKTMNVLIDIYLCGWSGTQNTGYPFDWSSQCSQYGNESDACQAFVAFNPDKFVQAYWLIEYLDAYQLSSNR